jgi:branched-chain amino acid transport system ATP-binding protein
MTAIFRAEGVSVRYGGVHALTDASIALEPGEVHGVIGPNGAGKSTFIDALSGRRHPTSGAVLYDGNDITRQPTRVRRMRGISRSFQRASVFPALTVRTQLEMAAHHTKETDLDSIVAALSIESTLDVVCRDLSYGTQRLVDLALALVGAPRVVLLDEPCAGLESEESFQMLDHVRRLTTERELAVLLVEHDVEGVFRVCDRITVLNLGQILTSGEPAAVRADPQVVAAYLGSAA